MNESQGCCHHGGGASEGRHTGSGKRGSSSRLGGAGLDEPGVVCNHVGDQSAPSPCGACKFLRRKCSNGCIFAPYFGSDQGTARFAAVHKVFGASNVSKLLSYISADWRHDAAATISYEAQARLSDPVYGCVSTVLALQQQVASLQAELMMVQAQLMNSRFAIANAHKRSSQGLQDQVQHIGVWQPACSNASFASNNHLININCFSSRGLEFTGETAPSHSFGPIQLPPTPLLGDDDDEEESHDPVSFTN